MSSPLDPEAWLAAAHALADAHSRLAAAGRDVPVTRRALAEIYQLLERAPHDVSDDFADVDPDYLDHCGTEWEMEILRGDFTWHGSFDDRHEALRVAAGQLRALDVALHSLVGSNARPSDPTGEWAVEDLDAFVVPRRRARRESLSAAGLSFSRNALVHHRVLPKQLGGCDLHFEWLDIHREPDAPSWERPLGAAMFRPFGLKTERVADDGEFIVSGNDPRPPLAAIDYQLDASNRDRCFAMVWPEVSMPLDRQTHVTQKLEARSADLNQPPFAVDLLVLGSWHEKDADNPGSYNNVARIVDAHGEPVAAHKKVMPYRSKRAKPKKPGEWFPRKEAIVRGNQLTIIVTQDQLVAVIICRDLCDRLGRAPFSKLDVDLVLVPSLGNETTVESHLSRAQDLHILFGTQTFVSQHAQNAGQLPAGAFGWVLRPGNPPAKIGSIVVQMAPYQPHRQLPP